MKDSEVLDSLEKINVELMAIYEELSFLRDETPSMIQKIPNQIRQVLPGVEQLVSDYRDALIFYNRDDTEKLDKILNKYK